MSDLHEEIVDVCLEVIEMEKDEIGLDDLFASFSHIDSLKALDLLTALEFKFKIKIPENEVRQFESIRKVIEVMDKHLPERVTA